MSSITTFELAKQAANELFHENVKPSVNKIREKLHGKGGQKTIQDALDEWWIELQQTLSNYQKREGIPEHLFKLTDQLWNNALATSSEKYTDEHKRHTQQINQLEEELHLERAEHEKKRDILLETRLENEHLSTDADSFRLEINTLNEALTAANTQHATQRQHWNDEVLTLTMDCTEEEHKCQLISLELSKEKEHRIQQQVQYEALLTTLQAENKQLNTRIDQLIILPSKRRATSGNQTS